MGNLRTAWVSHAWAERLGASWVLRFEDIDRPRVLPGAIEKQLEDMKALGLVPDPTAIQVQSQFEARHLELFERGVKSGKLYPCYCSRKEILAALQASASAPHVEGPAYSGRCRDRKDIPESQGPTLGWRFLAADPSGADDFIVARTNPDRTGFIPSYHWACAIDDFDGGYDLLVRAVDLRSAVEVQRAIQGWLAEIDKRPVVFPAVFHTSLVVQNDGHRLEKRTQGVTLDELLARGVSVQQILERFEKSFDPGLLKREISPGLILEEPREAIRLNELGF